MEMDLHLCFENVDSLRVGNLNILGIQNNRGELDHSLHLVDPFERIHCQGLI